jgi:hypothetical protein
MSGYRGFNVQRLREKYSCIPILRHHNSIISHGEIEHKNEKT